MKIKCECEGCTENNCRQVFNGETETCIQCTDVVNNDDYYEFTGEGSCQKVEPGSESFLINSTKQIVSSCNDPYSIKMGSICYKNQPKNSVKENEDNKYKCLYNYTKDTIDNLVYLNCLDLYKNCPSGYKYFTIINQRYYQCTKDSTDCNDNIYEEKIGDDTNYYCIDQCPSNKKYYYAEADNKNKCIEKCDFENHGDYFLSNEFKCKKNSETSCNGHINIDKEKNIFECVEGEECLNDYPYFFEKESSGESLKYCLKSCKYTESIGFLGNIKTYIFEETDTTTNKYKCLQNTNSYSPAIYYKDELALKWVDNCKTSISGPYFNKSDLTCYNSCEKYYKDFECVVICHNDGDLDQYVYKDESTKICYTECPTNLGKGFYNDQNQCQSCNLGEGYYKINDRKCYSGGDFCKINDKNYYYNYDDNYCFEKECKDYSKYKYHMSGGYKCHKSCSDLYTETEINIFEKDYTCYTVDPGTSGDFKYKYKSSSEFTKYITENQLTECLELNLKYLKNSECVKECDTSDYIVLPQQNRMGKCLTNDELTEANGCKYFNKSKICSNQCNFNKILEDGNLKVIDNENCVEKCPNDFYENAYDKTCLNTCGNELYHDEATHKCVSKCNPGFYEVEPKKKCVDKCKKIEENLEKFAYYMDTGECKSNCPETHPYSYDTTNDHQLCLSFFN